MKKKRNKRRKSLYFKILSKNIFFCFFLFFSNFSHSQSKIDSTNSLITGDFKIDSLNSSHYFDFGRESYASGDLEKSLDYFRKCYSIRKSIYPENHLFIAYVANRLGVVYKELGRLNEAIQSYLEVEKIYTNIDGPNTYRLGTPYSNLGNVYKQKGNFSDAISYHKKAIERFYLGDTTDVRVRNVILGTKYNLVENLYLSKKYNEALNTILSSYKQAPYYLKASFLGLLGNIYHELKDLEKAKFYYQQSINELKSNISVSPDSADLADLYLSYSDFLIETDQFEEASEALKKVKPLLPDIHNGIDISNLYYFFGSLYQKRQFDSNSLSNFRSKKIKNLDSALIFYQKAIIALSDNFTNQAPSSNPLIEQCKFPSNTLRILQSKAETYFELAQLRQEKSGQKMVDLENSLSASKLASDLLNNLRTGTVSEESKIVMTQLQNSIYLFSIKVAYELFSISGEPEYFETAFMNAERNKAASLLDNLTDENARQGSFLPDSLVQKEENINDRISFITQKLFEENQLKNPDSLRIAQYEDQLFQLNHDKNELERFLEKNFSDYYRLKYADDNISLASIQKLLHRDEVILEYVYEKANKQENSNNLYLFWVSKKGFGLQKTNVDSIYLKEIDTVYKFLSASDYINIPATNYINYIHSAYGLYNTLIKPVEKHIANKSITIVPDGKLSYIPFDALLSDIPDEIDTLNFKNLDYLVKEFSFNYSYSANLYLNRFNTEKRASKKLLAFAPDYGEYVDYADNDYNKLVPLAGIKQEVESIAGYIKSDTFIGADATESNFRKNYADYDILHLAMHAIMNDSLPMFSKLAFSPGQDSSISSPGWLYTEEIYNLKLNARLSVLSACNTGSGKLREGEGVISLARGFFYAGCPSIVMTLWEVEDRSGAELMGEFYRLLKAGKKKNEALRLAKLKHIENANPVTAHPHVWLCYVTIGNTDALNTSNDIYFFIGILVILLGILADQLMKNKKARKKFRA